MEFRETPLADIEAQVVAQKIDDDCILVEDIIPTDEQAYAAEPEVKETEADQLEVVSVLVFAICTLQNLKVM